MSQQNQPLAIHFPAPIAISLPDINDYVNRMIACSLTSEWIKLSNDLTVLIKSASKTIQENGIAEVFPYETEQRNIRLANNWIKVDELFFPFVNLEKNIACKQWCDTMAKYIGSFKDSSDDHSFCVNSDGKTISFIIPGDQNNQTTLNAFFPGISTHNLEMPDIQKPHSIWFGGIPSPINDDSVFLLIDTIIASLYGNTYAIYINFKTISNSFITTLIEKLETYLDSFKILNNLKISTGAARQFQGVLNMELDRESGNNLLKLLTLDIERCKIGQLKGFWGCEFGIFTEDENTLEKASSIISSVCGGNGSIPMKFQVRSKPFTTYYTSSELATVFSFPTKEFPGITIKQLHSFGANQTQSSEKSVKLGEVLFDMQRTKNTFSISLDTLKKHMLIAGITGSGKTTTVKKILAELSRNNIPFLVIEPVKSEYRDIEGVKFIEVGKDDFSISLFKPAALETPIITHIDYLRAVFGASFVLYPPMPYILESAIYHAYSKKKFAFDEKDSRCIHYPNIIDLIYSIEDIVNELKYSDRLRDDVLASLKIRFSNLLRGYKGKIFNATSSRGFDELMDKPTIINLNQIVDDEQKALLISILLANLYEYRMSRGAQQELQHVTIIEEAHRLLSKSTDNNPDAANPKAKAVEFFANLLAEIRSYGEGLIIAEQIPTKLIPDAIKNTGTKIIHKLVSMDDKLVVGNAMNFEDKQESFLTVLKPGQAIAFTEQTVKPVVIKIEEI